MRVPVCGTVLIVAEMGQTCNGKRAEAVLFRSAEAYLDMWKGVYR